MGRRKKKKNSVSVLNSLLVLLLLFLVFTAKDDFLNFIQSHVQITNTSYAMSDIPTYSGEPFVYINENKPSFTEEEITTQSFESYSHLDSLGRCGVAMASIGVDLMPTTERGSIGMVKPSGWHTIRYDHIDGKYLYNRCHLIGYQLTGENANVENLMTCTRSMNTGVMLDYENKVAKYIKETKNHVMYRVTPIFEGSNLVSSGVEMEGYSVEDEGKGISFHIYVYNVEDGVEINYQNGESKLDEE